MAASRARVLPVILRSLPLPLLRIFTNLAGRLSTSLTKYGCAEPTNVAGNVVSCYAGPPYCPPCTFVRPEPKTHSPALVYKYYGDPQAVVVQEEQCIRRPLRCNEILVQMILSPVNPMDLHMIRGKYEAMKCLSPPRTAGNEGVGQVLEVGSAVYFLRPGNYVIPNDIGFGTWRSQVVCRDDQVTCLPSDIDLISAATMSVAPCTAYRMLKFISPMCPGSTIILNAGNSAIGRAVTQLAAIFGYNTINIIRHRPGHKKLEDELRTLGATRVVTDKFLFSGQMPAMMESLRLFPSFGIDMVGGELAHKMASFLKNGSTLVRCGNLASDPNSFKPEKYSIQVVPITTYGFWRSMWTSEHNHVQMESVVKEIIGYIQARALVPPPCVVTEFRMFQKACKDTTKPYKTKKELLRTSFEYNGPFSHPQPVKKCSDCFIGEG